MVIPGTRALPAARFAFARRSVPLANIEINGVGWSDVRVNKMVPIRPTHRRLWGYERM
jgi:hypothetical protein